MILDYKHVKVILLGGTLGGLDFGIRTSDYFPGWEFQEDLPTCFGNF